MLPSRHIIASLSLGTTVGLLSQSINAAVLCVVAGVLIDLDHVLEYIIHFGLKTFNLKEIYRACGRFIGQDGESVKKVYLFLHAVEISILLWIAFAFSRNLYLLSIALGYTGHLIMDISASPMRPGAYFIIARIKNGFDVGGFLKAR